MRKATGVRIADKTVLKVMREEGLLCRTRRRRKYRSYMGQVGKSSPNLLARDFEAEDPMTKLMTDVTEFKVGGTKLCLSPVVDLYNDEVVAYSISRSPNMKMVLEMLAGLEGRLDGEDAPVLHSDSKNVASRFCGNRNGAVSCSRDRVAASWPALRLTVDPRILTRTAIDAMSFPGYVGCSGRFRRRPSPPRSVTQEGPDACDASRYCPVRQPARRERAKHTLRLRSRTCKDRGKGKLS